MKKSVYLLLLVGLLIPANALTAAGGSGARSGDPVEQTPAVSDLNILWAEWAPAAALQTVADRYSEETGITVHVVQAPWSAFPQTFFIEMEEQGDQYDMVVGDSMWLGRGASAGYYVELTEFLTSEDIAASVVPATLASFAEFPAGSGQYWRTLKKHRTCPVFPYAADRTAGIWGWRCEESQPNQGYVVISCGDPETQPVQFRYGNGQFAGYEISPTHSI